MAPLLVEFPSPNQPLVARDGRRVWSDGPDVSPVAIPPTTPRLLSMCLLILEDNCEHFDRGVRRVGRSPLVRSCPTVHLLEATSQ